MGAIIIQTAMDPFRKQAGSSSEVELVPSIYESLVSKP